MIVVVDRSSVAAGDDVESHVHKFEFPNGATLTSIVTTIARSGWLASIGGGLATWSVASNVFVAIVAEQWPAPKMLFFDQKFIDPDLDRRGGVLHLYFNYHAQIDPDIVHQVLARARVRI